MFSIDKALLIMGTLLIVSGSLIMVLQGIRVSYDVEDITIPFYDFKYYGPGTYTEKHYERLELCSINNVQVLSNNPVEINCITTEHLQNMLKDKNYVECKFSSDVIVSVYAYSINNEPFKLEIALNGCTNNVCSNIISFTANSKKGTGVIEGEYAIKKLIVPYNVQIEQGLGLEYEMFKAVLETDKIATIKELKIFIPAICDKLQKIDYPMLKVDKSTQYYTIACIKNIDTRGLTTGFILNTIGLALMIGGIYLSRTKHY